MFKFLWPCFIEMVQFSCVTLNSGCSYEPLEKILHLCKISTLSAMASMKHSIITFLHSFVEYLWHSYTVLYGHNLKWCLNDKASWYRGGNPSKRDVFIWALLGGGVQAQSFPWWEAIWLWRRRMEREGKYVKYRTPAKNSCRKMMFNCYTGVLFFFQNWHFTHPITVNNENKVHRKFLKL